MVLVFRKESFADLVNTDTLFEEMRHLEITTTYGKNARDCHAPGITNCVTAVRRVLKQSSNGALTLPPCWIGDMPRYLVLSYGWSVIDTDVPRTGDLLFLGADYERADLHKKRITHVMMWFEGFVFHSTHKFPAGAKLEPFQVSHLVVRQTIHDLITYIDPRNLRERAALNRVSLHEVRSLEDLPEQSLRLRISRPPLSPPPKKRTIVRNSR